MPAIHPLDSPPTFSEGQTTTLEIVATHDLSYLPAMPGEPMLVRFIPRWAVDGEPVVHLVMLGPDDIAGESPLDDVLATCHIGA